MAGEVRDRRALAALNNAEWCDTVCRALGMPGRIGTAAWVQPRIGPPYYSNMVTLTPGAIDEQLAAIAGLKSALPGGFSVKDSFATLDLAPYGFRLLFAAEWIWRAPRSGPPAGDVEWDHVSTEPELMEWEAAWAANGSPSATRVFQPPLLDNDRFAFFAGRRAGHIVAGVAANRSDHVAGISNFFAEPGDTEMIRAGAVAMAQRFAPEVPLVGYERDSTALSGFAALGFVPIGALRVWLWEPGA